MTDSAWDVFISYAHADDEVPLGASKGWVTTLKEELQKVLRRRLGGIGARVFMDHQLAANEGVTPSLRSGLASSRTLVLVMSPGYQRSNWCQLELARFLEGQAASKNQDTVFVVEIDPVDRGTLPQPLRDLKLLTFWEKDPSEIAPRLLGFPVPSADEDSRYWRKVNELAHLLAERLTRAESRAAVPAPTVWLAESTEDLLEERDSIAAAFSQQGCRVLPASPYPREGARPFREALQRDLEQAVLLIQLLGPREGHRPNWGEPSFVALQAAEAAAVAVAKGVRSCQWRAPEIDPSKVASEDYRRLLLGEQVIAARIEVFKREVLERLAAALAPPKATLALHKDPAGSEAPGAFVSAELFVYVNANVIDRDLGRTIQDSLSALGVASALARTPAAGDDLEDVRRLQQEHLGASDGVVVVYGEVLPTWVQFQYTSTRKARAQLRRRLPIAILDGPPDRKEDVGLRGPGLLLLDCRAGFEARVLTSFVDSLRAEAASA